MKAARSDSISFRGALLVVLLLACSVRGGVIAYYPGVFAADPDGYRELAVNLRTYGIFGYGTERPPQHPTAFRPPGYPWLLSWLVQAHSLPAGSVAVLHLLLGAATAGLVLGVGWHLLFPRRPWCAIGAAVLVICDPILLVQSAQLMTETLAAFLTMATWYCWLRLQREVSTKRSAWWGAALGACLLAGFLVRPVSVVWAALLGCVGVIALARRQKLNLAVAMVMLMLGIGAWTWRNQRALGAPIWATTHGGYTLLLANNPLLYDHLEQNRWPAFWDAEPFLRRYDLRGGQEALPHAFWYSEAQDLSTDGSLSELQDDARAGRAARVTIQQRPLTFLYSCLVRIVWLWQPWPQIGPGWGRIAIGVWYTIIYLSIGVAIGRRRREIFRAKWWPAWTLILALTATHAVYWSNLRMRAPAIPFLALLAVASIALPQSNEKAADLSPAAA